MSLSARLARIEERLASIPPPEEDRRLLFVDKLAAMDYVTVGDPRIGIGRYWRRHAREQGVVDHPDAKQRIAALEAIYHRE